MRVRRRGGQPNNLNAATHGKYVGGRTLYLKKQRALRMLNDTLVELESEVARGSEIGQGSAASSIPQWRGKRLRRRFLREMKNLHRELIGYRFSSKLSDRIVRYSHALAITHVFGFLCEQPANFKTEASYLAALRTVLHYPGNGTWIPEDFMATDKEVYDLGWRSACAELFERVRRARTPGTF